MSRAGIAAWKRWALRLGAALLALALGGFLVAASGVVPIKASSGHWAITAWLLHFAMKRSVAFHTVGTAAPALDDPAMILKGAGHYETACFPCHGSPEQETLRIAQKMTPFPPNLSKASSGWQAEELFYVVKHGVKFTGMPAWPAPQRDDEVWAMVAFLRRLPQLDKKEYRRLVHGEPSPGGEVARRSGVPAPESGVPRAIRDSCGRCHGVDGRGRREGAFPRLAGQRPEYLLGSLQAFARGERHSGIMEPVAAGLKLEELRALADYYTGQPAAEPAPPSDPAAVQRGEAIARRGLPGQRVPGCIKCHGPGVRGRNPSYPELAGQPADYLLLHLTLFKQERRGGTSYARLMRPVVAGLNPEQMRDVAMYYASLPHEK